MIIRSLPRKFLILGVVVVVGPDPYDPNLVGRDGHSLLSEAGAVSRTLELLGRQTRRYQASGRNEFAFRRQCRRTQIGFGRKLVDGE